MRLAIQTDRLDDFPNGIRRYIEGLASALLPRVSRLTLIHKRPSEHPLYRSAGEILLKRSLHWYYPNLFLFPFYVNRLPFDSILFPDPACPYLYPSFRHLRKLRKGYQYRRIQFPSIRERGGVGIMHRPVRGTGSWGSRSSMEPRDW